jgi:hypothetical protein
MTRVVMSDWPRPAADDGVLKVRSNASVVELRIDSEPRYYLTLSHPLARELAELLFELTETRH